MESQVSRKWYICLELIDGEFLYFNNEHHLKNWSAFRREGTAWMWENAADEALLDHKLRDNVPSNARVVGIKTTIEEVK